MSNLIKRLYWENQNGYNNIIIFTGIGGRRVRVGKTYAALDVASKLQAMHGIEFETDDILFLSGELFGEIEKRTKRNPDEYITIVFDDAGLEASARQAMSLPNIVLSGVLQISGFLKFNFFFTVPDKNMIDINIRRLLNARHTLYTRGKGFLVYPWYESKLPDVETPWLMDEMGFPEISYENPENYLDPDFLETYQERKKKFTYDYIIRRQGDIKDRLKRKTQKIKSKK